MDSRNANTLHPARGSTESLAAVLATNPPPPSRCQLVHLTPSKATKNKSRPSAGSVLCQRRWRWHNIESALGRDPLDRDSSRPPPYPTGVWGISPYSPQKPDDEMYGWVNVSGVGPTASQWRSLNFQQTRTLAQSGASAGPALGQHWTSNYV